MKWIYEFRYSILIFLSVFALLVLIVGRVGGGLIRFAAQDTICAKVHVVGLALFAYANDHQGHYPEGKTSTEIFQQLVDERYIGDPWCLFVDLPGKVPCKGTQLRPENIGYDFTGGAGIGSSPELPLVYLTGYRVTYSPGAKAVPIASGAWTWFDRLLGGPELDGIFICRINTDTTILRRDKDGTIPNFIPADFDPKGQVYRQLTP